MGRSSLWQVVPVATLALSVNIGSAFSQQSGVVIPEPPGFAINLRSEPLKAPSVVIPKPAGVANPPIHDDVVTLGSPQGAPLPAKTVSPPSPTQVVRNTPQTASIPAKNTLVGETFAGTARVVDGNTITIAGQSIVLHGADAPEIGQYCNDIAGLPWDCGAKASQHLGKIIASTSLTCIGVETVPTSIAATCFTNGEDISRRMILDGYAVVPDYLAPLYRSEQAEARSATKGLWIGSFTLPWDYRAIHQSIPH